MISVVNGYVCRSCCDEAVARKGRDPRNPTDNPVKKRELAIRDGDDPATAFGKLSAAGVAFGRAVSAVSSTSATPADRSPRAGFVGGFLDVTA